MFGKTQKVPGSNINPGTVMQWWIHGMNRPIIGKLNDIVVIEEGDGDIMMFIIDDGDDEIPVRANSVAALAPVELANAA